MFGAMDFGIADDGERTRHEQAAQIAVTLLADMAEPVLAPARMLLRHQPNPGREIAPRSEGLWVGNGSDQSGRQYRTDARNLVEHSRLRSRIGARPRAGLVHTAGGPFDQGGDGIGVGDLDSVAARHVNDGGAGPLRHELLRGIRNHLVVADLEIPARLGLPSRLRDRAAKGVDAPRYLGVGYEDGGLPIDVAGEGVREFDLVQELGSCRFVLC
jgi:hypothetical protein